MTTTTEVRIAGVPWPVYKLVALAIGILVLVVVGVVTTSVGSAVLAATAATSVAWLGFSLFNSADA